MTNNTNTKILRYDLDRELRLVFEQLDELKKDQGNINLFEIFKNVNVSMLGDDIKGIITDLIIANKKTDLTASERIEKLEKNSGYSVDSLMEGNFNETFAYDSNGEIIKHTATGDISFVTDYTYGPLVPVETGVPVNSVTVLTGSSSKFISSQGRNVEVKKAYKYDKQEVIVGISTQTIMDVTPPGSVVIATQNASVDSTGKPVMKVTWSNPGDSDFSHVNVYLVEAATSKVIDVMPNIKNGTLTWDLSMLPSGVFYNLNFKTVDKQKNEQPIGLAVNFKTPEKI